jgi:multidrug transporter EmrE-like cation transporter
MSAWGLVVLGGLLLGGMAYAIRRSVTDEGWSSEIMLIVLAVAGLWAVQKAAESLPAGAALAAALGVAAVAALGLGVIVLREALSTGQMLAGALLAAGAIGLVATSMR